MIDKAALKQRLITLMEEEARLAGQEYKQYKSASQIDSRDSIDIDDQGQAVAAADIAQAFGQDADNAQAKIRHIAELDFGPKTEVQEGAVVKVDGQYLIIALATDVFTFKGEEYRGISLQAPIFAALEGKRAGDGLSFRGKSITIEGVW